MFGAPKTFGGSLWGCGWTCLHVCFLFKSMLACLIEMEDGGSLSKSMKPNYSTIMNKDFILTELFLRKSRIMKSDIVSTVV
jgi:hypothetical protein